MKKTKLPSLPPLKPRLRGLEARYASIQEEIGEHILSVHTYSDKAKKRIITRVKTLLDEHKLKDLAFCEENVKKAYDEASTRAEERLKQIGATLDYTYKEIEFQESIEKYTALLYGDFQRAKETIIGQVKLYFRLLKEATEKKRKASLQFLDKSEIIEEGVDRIVTEGAVVRERVTKAGHKYYAAKSRGEISKEIKLLFEKTFGKLDFIAIDCKDGIRRHYQASSWFKMQARTRMRECQTHAVRDRCKQWQNDLVRVSSHDNPCKRCADFEGEVFSLSGDHPKYPVLDNFPPHPNCEHHIDPTSEVAIQVEEEYRSLAA